MAETRDFLLGSIWANGATAAAGTPVAPVQGTAYRNTTASFADGFQFLSKSPSEIANQFLYIAAKSIDQLQTHGTLGWNSATAYVQGALCHASDGQQYISLSGVGNTNKDPVDLNNSAYWVVLKPVPGDFTKAVNGSTTLDNGIQFRWGQLYTPGSPYSNNDVVSVSFVKPFSNACWLAFPTPYNPLADGAKNGTAHLVSTTVAGFSFQVGSDTIPGIVYYAVGY